MPQLAPVALKHSATSQQGAPPLSSRRQPQSGTDHGRSHGRRSHFIDDQAAGERSPSPIASPISSPDRHLRRPSQPVHRSAHAADHKSSSGGSDSDRPLAAKRHRSMSLQEQSAGSDRDFSSNADSPAGVTGHPNEHQVKVRKKRVKSGQHALSRAEVRSRLRDSQVAKSSLTRGTDMRQPTSHDTHNQAAPQSIAGTDEDDMEDASELHEDGEPEPGLETGVAQEEEEGPAFEVPSQMPRELQSWAWDK